jgi:uncharacterized phage protein (TIGR02220 family)
VAWQQTPCGSLPDDDELIAKKIGLDPKYFLRTRDGLMSGWIRHSDGRLYHRVITEKVLAMLGMKAGEAKRKADYRARQRMAAVPKVSRGTDVGLLRDSTRNPLPEPEPVPEELQRQSQKPSPEAVKPSARVGNGGSHGNTALAREILDFLNNKTGRHFRPVKANLDPILARIKEGATQLELQAVIVRQHRQWAEDDKMRTYLRPATLFNATKFAQYVGDVPPPKDLLP